MSRLIRGLLSASGSSSAAPGQATFTESGTEEWVVPEGVFSISVVLVGRGGLENPTTAASAGTAPTELKRGNNVLLFAQNGGAGSGLPRATGTTIGGNIGGGDGGLGGNSSASRFATSGGGGGAGGYSGDGGNASGGSGSGGAGGAGFSVAGAGPAGGGGGVGLIKIGSNGSAGQGGSGGSNAVGLFGGNFGGGQGGRSSTSLFGTAFFGGGGGALRYYNNLPVTPGETLTIVKPANVAGVGSAAARIIWPGDQRQFPNTRTEDE